MGRPTGAPCWQKKRFDQLGDAPRDLSSRLHQEPEANASEAVLAAGELTRAGTRSATARGRGHRPTATPKGARGLCPRALRREAADPQRPRKRSFRGVLERDQLRGDPAAFHPENEHGMNRRAPTLRR